MTEFTATRTLVKSSPELWAECSDAASLARHLGGFGEIRITRLEPETAVAWEGERASGTVRLEPSGWGTKVTFTAAGAEAVVAGAAVAEPEPEPAVGVEPEAVEPPAPEPVAVAAAPEPPAPPEPAPPQRIAAPVVHAPPPRKGLFGRLAGWLGGGRPEPAPVPVAPPVVRVAPAPVAEEPVVQEPVVQEPPAVEEAPASLDTEAALTAALDSLGQAHHRPFSRS